MYYEYALDPSLLSNWKDFRYFYEKFGWYNGRLISRYPKHWKKIVYESLNKGGLSDIQMTKMVEILQRGIDTKLVRRKDAQYLDQMEWVCNAKVEHEKRPFHAIITKSNLENCDHILCADEVNEDEHSKWRVGEKRLLRKASAYAAELSLLLCNSKKIRFVDPHFRGHLDRFKGIIKEILCEIGPGAVCDFELHTGITEDYDYFKERMEKNITKLMPQGTKMCVFVWKEKPESEELHNRFILTDLAGVSFGTGLDESKTSNSTAKDIVKRLSDDEYKELTAQYHENSTAFDKAGEKFIIEGTIYE
ncbi:MAG: hypothetical protein HQM16_17885 [Deltaproteobacteria bacterium]|nr:hypothetical protein [Deltaproteobacteria bacterium]